MDQRAARQEGYGYSDALNGDWSVQRQQQQLLSPTNSDYQVKPLDGNAPPVFRGPVVNPAQRPPPPRHSVAAQRRPRRPSPYPCAVEDFDPSQHQQVAAVPEHPRLAAARRQQYARSVAAPVDSRSSISGSSKASSRASIVEKKMKSKKAIAERKLTPGDQLPRVPRSVAAPDESRSSLSSVSVSKLSRREAKKLIKQLREIAGEESRNSSRKQKKAAKKVKKGSKGSKKDKKNRQEDSSNRRRRSASKKAQKNVRFENNNALLENARRHREILARENAKCSGTGVTFNGFVKHDLSTGYFDLTSSPDEPGFLIKVPAHVMRLALQIADPVSLQKALNEQKMQRERYIPAPIAPPTLFKVYGDSDIQEDGDYGYNRRQPTPAESRRLSVPANHFNGSRRASLSSQRR